MTIWIMNIRFFLILLLVIGIPTMGLAKDASAPKKLGEFKGWQAYEASIGGHSTCYMMLRPNKQEYTKQDYKKAVAEKAKSKDKKKKTEPVAAKRSDVYMMITFRPSESMSPVISYRSGYIFKQASEVLLSTGDKPFNLFTDRDQAWARSGAMDGAITNAVRKAKQVVIQGISNDGGKSTDHFSPDGAENAYKAVIKACGIT
ncbi:MAG: hypothetical protein EB059_06295 [Alphaproteobacteria bacterium]|nr:hypothetical protein [Alphaproteobacteria bacterium]